MTGPHAHDGPHAHAGPEGRGGQEDRSRAPLLGAVVGVPAMAYGAWGLVADGARTRPAEAARWVVGAAVVHDLLWLPVILAVAALVTRRLPPPARGPVAGGLAASAVLAIVTWPYAAGYGEDPTIPSLLVRDEATGLVAYLVVVWAVVASVVALRLVRSRECEP